MANPLDPVMQWYKAASDSMRVTHRVLTKGITGAITAKHVFHKKPVGDCKALLNSAKTELDRLVVLGLTAIFERTLRDYLVQYTQTALPTGDPHRDAVREEILKDIEFWNVSARVMEVFPAVGANIRGQVKQIIDYRNWVAHGHTLAKPEPSKVVPDRTHRVFTAFLLQAGVITP